MNVTAFASLGSNNNAVLCLQHLPIPRREVAAGPIYLHFNAGYCFLLFEDEKSVQALVRVCLVENSKLYWHVSSPTMKDKAVGISACNCYFVQLQCFPQTRSRLGRGSCRIVIL